VGHETHNSPTTLAPIYETFSSRTVAETKRSKSPNPANFPATGKPVRFEKEEQFSLFEKNRGNQVVMWRAEADETENYVYAIALQN